MTRKVEVKRYEKPELKTLFNDLEAAVGSCIAGTSVTSGVCSGGGSPGTPCVGGTGFGK